LVNGQTSRQYSRVGDIVGGRERLTGIWRCISEASAGWTWQRRRRNISCCGCRTHPSPHRTRMIRRQVSSQVGCRCWAAYLLQARHVTPISDYGVTSQVRTSVHEDKSFALFTRQPPVCIYACTAVFLCCYTVYSVNTDLYIGQPSVL